MLQIRSGLLQLWQRPILTQGEEQPHIILNGLIPHPLDEAYIPDQLTSEGCNGLLVGIAVVVSQCSFKVHQLDNYRSFFNSTFQKRGGGVSGDQDRWPKEWNRKNRKVTRFDLDNLNQPGAKREKRFIKPYAIQISLNDLLVKMFPEYM
ncbi:hypothetical protein [Desulfosediminicola ganghwensis]|uniref:hypothetical protein n=1 Tax=Desulfosediminicola ganghwensis TaxID=2569540 RepID=UPI0015948EC9|nr:hypothetical protein [Desulfosediminicola ganghwensis]